MIYGLRLIALISVVFSFSVAATQANLKRKADNLPSQRDTKRRCIGKIPSTPNNLHSKVNKAILIEGHLIKPSKQKRARELHQPNEKLSRQDPTNPFNVSIVGDANACFALHPGKAILGQGKMGTVKLAQIIYLDTESPGAHLFKAGDWVAVKIQDEEFENEEIEGLKLTENLVAFPFEYDGKDGTRRYASAMRLIEGHTLKEWLLAHDPQKKFDLGQFIHLTFDLCAELARQFHCYGMTNSDKSLDNMIVKDNNLIYIDFGNVCKFDDEVKSFYESRDEDTLLTLAAIFEHLCDASYPIDLQNAYWIYAYDYTAADLFPNESAYYKLFNSVVALPPFLEAIYGEDGPDFTITDEQIDVHVEDYLKEREIPYIEFVSKAINLESSPIILHRKKRLK